MANADYRVAPGVIPRVSRVTTTDSVATLGQEVPITKDGNYLLEVEVICTRKSGESGTAGDGACYTRTLRVKSVSGVVSIATAQTDYTNEDQRAWAVVLGVSGNSVQVSVRGATSNTIDWTIKSSLHIQL